MKTIEFMDGYRVSDNGVVESSRKSRGKRWVKYAGNPNRGSGGYRQVKLAGGYMGVKTWFIHRLVAIHFIPNPLNKPEVNHIDGDKSNNDISNLEWVTKVENAIHANAMGLMNRNFGADHHQSKSIMCIETGEVFVSAIEARDKMGLTDAARKNISNVCKGKRNSTGGYGWKYV